MRCELGTIISDIAAGPFGSNLKVECFVEQGFPIIDGANLKGIKVTDNVTKFVTEEKARSLHRSIARRGDVVVTISGNVGQIAYIPENSVYEEYLVSQRQFRVTFDSDRVHVPYLVYYFHTYEGQNQILAFANQTGVPALSQPLKNFKKIEIDLPPIEEQQRISRIAELLTAKIEVNHRINDNLEQQAMALVESILASGEPTVLGQLMSFENGFAFQSSTYQSAGTYRVITIKNVQDGRIDSTGAAYLSDIPKKMKSSCLLKPGDALLSLTGNVGRVGIVCEENLLLNQRVAKISAMNPTWLPFLYFMFRLPSTKTMLESIAKGTAQQNLSPVETLKLEIPFDKVLVDTHSGLLSRIYATMLNTSQENLRLAAMRDALLPKLMSGEIDVSDTEI